ncbi:hypothetical protein V1478_017236 [Vespula squamosa]|uniref:Uncharacterized protein n=1 Tax=Vespula squamosa TaxID=30214 RepID=A0ABD1ZXE1_VESSQ
MHQNTRKVKLYRINESQISKRLIASKWEAYTIPDIYIFQIAKDGPNGYHGTQQIRSETGGNGWSISETGSNNRMISVLETNGRSTIIIMIISPGGSSRGNRILKTAPYRFAISADGSGSAKLYGLCEPDADTSTFDEAVLLARADLGLARRFLLSIIDSLGPCSTRETRDSSHSNFAKADDRELVDRYFLTKFTFLVFTTSSRNLVPRIAKSQKIMKRRNRFKLVSARGSRWNVDYMRTSTTRNSRLS